MEGPVLSSKSVRSLFTVSVSVSVSAQDGIVALGKAHYALPPPVRLLAVSPRFALETMPIFVWLNTDRSRPWRVRMSAASFLHSSFLQAVNAVMLWLVRAGSQPT